MIHGTKTVAGLLKRFFVKCPRRALFKGANMSHKRATTPQMNGWNQVWMMDGQKIICRRCGGQQWPGLDDGAFRHSDSCVLGQNEPRYPWKELTEALKAELADARRMLH